MSEDVVMRDPFGPTARAATYVPRPATDEAFSRLERAVLDDRQIALVQGPAGLGKTLLLRRLAESARGRLTPVYLPYASLTPDELCSWTLEALGANAVDDAPTVFRMWVSHLSSEGTPLLLLVDDATALPAETARWLVQLVKGSELRLALAALEVPGSVLRDELPDDVEFIRLAEPMSELETRDYVSARLGMAEVAADCRAAFDGEILEKLYRISRGNPRRLHHAAGAVLRGTDPDSIVAFLDGAEPSAEAREEAAQRVAATAALAAERLAAREARAAEAESMQPEFASEPAAAETGLELAEVEVPPEVAAELELDPAEVAAAADPAVGEPEPLAAPPIPEASRVLEEALGHDPELLRDLGFDEGEEQPSAPESEAVDEVRLLTDASASTVFDDTFQQAADALREATDVLREATFALGAPGTARGQARAALRDAVEALRDAITTAADIANADRPPWERRTEQAGVVAAAFARVAIVVGGSALLGATAAVFFFGLRDAAHDTPEPSAAVVAEAAASPAEEVAPKPEVFQIGINASPWASVGVDGTQIGDTPIADLELTAGLHIFRARMPDGRIVVRRVEVGPETKSLVFR